MTTETASAPAAAPAPEAAAVAQAAPAAAPAAAQPTTQAPAPAPAAGNPAGSPSAPEGAPAEYAAFKLPDGVEVHADVLARAKADAKALNLPQDAAQKVVDLAAQAVQKAQASAQEQLTGLHQQWAAECKADTEFGGDKLAENLARASACLEKVGTPQLRTLLERSGLGSHPEVVRHFLKIAPAVLDDKFIPGTRAPGGDTDARAIYSKSNMNP